MKTAVAIFGFNRKDHIENLFKSILETNDFSDLDFFIFIDGPRNDNDLLKVNEVLTFLADNKSISFTEKLISPQNKGLASSIISGVTGLFDRGYDSLIVLEDDLILSKDYFSFMKACLTKYQNDPDIYSASGYNYPSSRLKIPESYPYDIYFSYRPHSWGWGTWKEKWSQGIWDIRQDDSVFTDKKATLLFNRGGGDLTNMLSRQLEGKINSWAIRWAYTHYKRDKLAVYPVHSHVDNTGFDGSGTHCRNEVFFYNDLSRAINDIRFPPKVIVNDKIIKEYYTVFPFSKGLRPKDLLRKIYQRFFKPSAKRT